MPKVFQTRVTSNLNGYLVSSDWKEREFYDAECVEDILRWIHQEEDIGCLTGEVEDFIGDEDYEYDFEISSCQHSVLRVNYRFTYFNKIFGDFVTKAGYITIME